MFSTLKATQSKPHLFVHNRLGWVIVRFFVAAVLLIAAGLKAYQLATMPDFGNSFFEARWFQILLIESEIALALILLFGIVPKISWLVTIILFMIFSIVSLAKGLSGAESCGCWEAMQVSPYFTMGLDIGIIGLLWVFRPFSPVFCFQSFIDEFLFFKKFQLRKLSLVVLTWFVVIIPITYAMFSVNKTDFGHLGVEFVGLDGKKVLLLTPEKWIDHEFPLLPYIEKSDTIEGLKNGQWTVILFSHHCEKCKKTLSEFIANKTPNVLCIEIPPYGECPKDLEYVKLKEIQKWFVDTPVVIKINDLIVENIAEQ
jgi:hypothetical protein